MKRRLIFDMRVWILSALVAFPTSGLATWAERLKGALPTAPAGQGTAHDAESSIPVEIEYGALVGAIKDLLLQASARALDASGTADGFALNPAIRITLPGFLNDAAIMLRGVGLSPQSDLIEKEMNRAAETGAAAAGLLFAEEIERLAVTDPRAVVVGPADAATRFLRRRAAETLFEALRPTVETALLENQTAKGFAELNHEIGRRLPALGTLEDINLADYVTVRTLEGVFLLMSEEEKRIREDPAAQSTERLRETFSH